MIGCIVSQRNRNLLLLLLDTHWSLERFKSPSCTLWNSWFWFCFLSYDQSCFVLRNAGKRRDFCCCKRHVTVQHRRKCRLRCSLVLEPMSGCKHCSLKSVIPQRLCCRKQRRYLAISNGYHKRNLFSTAISPVDIFDNPTA